MRKSRLTEEQIVGILQESAAGAKTGELIRRHGISRETCYKWRHKYGGLQVSDAKRLRTLEDENRRLKRVVADRALKLQVLKDLLGKACHARRGAQPRNSRPMTTPTMKANHRPRPIPVRAAAAA